MDWSTSLSNGISDITNLVGQAGVLVGVTNAYTGGPGSATSAPAQVTPAAVSNPGTSSLILGVLAVVGIVIVFKVIA